MPTVTITDRSSMIPGSPGSVFDRTRRLIIETAQSADGPWTVQPECEASDLTLQSANNGVDTFTFQRRYGMIRFPHEAANIGVHQVDSWLFANVAGMFVRLSWVENKALVEQLGASYQSVPIDDNTVRYLLFVGIIQSPSAATSGGGLVNAANQPVQSGVQRFTAYGMTDYLRRVPVLTSKFLDDTQGTGLKRVEVNRLLTPNYMPNVANESSGKDGYYPNRSDSYDAEQENNGIDTYLFGSGQKTVDNTVVPLYWSRAQYAQYIIRNYVCKYANGSEVSPKFRLIYPSGSELFDGTNFYLTENDLLEKGADALTILQRVFPQDLGYDFFILPYNGDLNQNGIQEDDYSGFLIVAYHIHTDMEVNFNISNTHTLGGTPEFSDSQEQRYKNIAVLGNRIKTVCSFALSFNRNEFDSSYRGFPYLHPAWDEDLETDYCNARYSCTGNWTSPESFDATYPTKDEHDVLISDKVKDVTNPLARNDKFKEEQIRAAAAMNDEYRKQDKFADVFTKWKLPNGFSPTVFYAGLRMEAQIPDEPDTDKVMPDGSYYDANNLSVFMRRGGQFLDIVPYMNLIKLTDLLTIKQPVIANRDDVRAGYAIGFEDGDTENKELFAFYPLQEFEIIANPIRGEDWSIRIRSNPQHFWLGEINPNRAFSPTKNQPSVNGDNLYILNLCFEEEFRIAKIVSLPNARESLGTLLVELDADYIYQCPYTITGLKDGVYNIANVMDGYGDVFTWNDNTVQFYPSKTDFDWNKQIIKSDYPLIAEKANELYDLYTSQWNRAVVPLRGEFPIAHLIGGMIGSYQDADKTLPLNSRIQSIEFTFGSERVTTITSL